MKERREEDILAKAPIRAKLGEAEYEIKPLTILKAREWRKQLTTAMESITQSFGQSSTPGNLGPALTSALIQFPEKVAELVFAYAPELPKDKILEEATEEQLCTAFSAIMRVAFPFLGQLGTTVQLMKANL